MRRGGWSRTCGSRWYQRRIGRVRREVARTITPALALAVRRAMGIINGSHLSLEELAAERPGRDFIRQMLRALASWHVHRNVRFAPRQVRRMRALFLRLSRCMALISRRLTLSNSPGPCRSGPGVPAV